MRHLFLLPGLLALVLLAGCSGTISRPAYVYEGYDATTLSGPAAQGGALLQVTGNPFAAPQGELEATLARTFEAHHFGPRFAVLTEPPGNRTLAYRIVVVFDPAVNAGTGYACAQESLPRSPGGPRLAMLAAFCEYDRVMSSTVAYGGPFTGLGDPGFAAMVKQVSLSIFPPVPANRDNQDGDTFIP